MPYGATLPERSVRQMPHDFSKERPPAETKFRWIPIGQETRFVSQNFDLEQDGWPPGECDECPHNREPLIAHMEITVTTVTHIGEPRIDDDGWEHDGTMRQVTAETRLVANRIQKAMESGEI